MSFALWPLLCIAMAAALFLVIRRIDEYRGIGPDRRYLELAPGTEPADDRISPVGPSPRTVQIPTRFAPPDFSVAVAGLLLYGAVRGRDLAATLVELQRRNIIAVEDTDPVRYRVRLLSGGEPADVPEEALLARMFRHGSRGPVDLADRDVLAGAAEAYASGVVRTAVTHGWFARLPEPHDLHTWALPLAFGGAVSVAEIGLFQAVPAIGPGLLTVGAARWLTSGRFRRGSRTALGRAMTDQVQGFRDYLRSAEADQLRFEADEDLYSRYLPWAVGFGIADRWSSVCRQALDNQELPDFRLPPTWMLRAFFTVPREMPE